MILGVDTYTGFPLLESSLVSTRTLVTLLQPGHVVGPLYDDYLCLEASN